MNKVIRLLFFCTLGVYSQNKGIITYSVSKVKIDTQKYFEGKKDNPELKKMVNSFINTKDELTYLLYFNADESIFFKSKKLNLPNRKEKLLDILAGNGVYYVNLNDKKVLHQKEFGGELFLVQSNFFKWTLTQDVKIIKNYKCYKAIGVKTVENSKGIFKKKVVAWYAPSININFGPKEYTGLAGAILELNDSDLMYSVRKIDLNTKKEIKIKKPKKGKKLTDVEFELMTKKLFYERNWKQRN
ncbi:GLPGLI family protein [Polaribacter sp. KT 15]|uniref:GLPGLI family protein n=1 Tax=Polaribacter sp. KT 15 TaxID=1896175 RepID=UPI000909B93C|nr:GLPGLI family protein [Polaribacter sp. KT 15]SHM91144.1 GLPGLI family protein [Polaribacter sp. KT 15]